MKKRKRTTAKKPRTLNAVWADARCHSPGPGYRYIELRCDTPNGKALTASQALRLSQWLAEAAAWKGEE